MASGQPLREDGPASSDGNQAEEMISETALIIYNLFEDPTYFLEWGIKGTPFYLACVNLCHLRLEIATAAISTSCVLTAGAHADSEARSSRLRSTC